MLDPSAHNTLCSSSFEYKIIKQIISLIKVRITWKNVIVIFVKHCQKKHENLGHYVKD